MGDVDAKVRHEVAVMKLIRSRTGVPVPEIVAWGPSHACPLELGPFIIMHFVEGRVLGRLMEIPGHLPNGKILKDDIDRTILEHIYRQVARFLLELAEVEFSSIGTIVEDENVFGVESGPVSVKMNDIERQDGISLRGKT
jgi:aminoglycoside phosphotransferase (APT) family kinase protein